MHAVTLLQSAGASERPMPPSGQQVSNVSHLAAFLHSFSQTNSSHQLLLTPPLACSKLILRADRSFTCRGQGTQRAHMGHASFLALACATAHYHGD